MTKISWLNLAIDRIKSGQPDKAVQYINEVIEIIRIEENSIKGN